MVAWILIHETYKKILEFKKENNDSIFWLSQIFSPMPVSNFDSTIKWNGAAIDFSLAAIGTAFELTLGEVILRRGLKVCAPPTDGTQKQYWFAKLSVLRQTGESQDLRELMDGIPLNRHVDVELRPVHLTPDAFTKWVKTIPRPVRDLCGHEPAPRGRPQIPATLADGVDNAETRSPRHATKRFKKNSDWRVKRESPGIDVDVVPLSVRVAALEDKFTFLESLLSTFVGK